MSQSKMISHSKYKSKKTIIDGITFDSKKEGKRYLELKGMQENGEIKNLRLQPSFELQPHFKLNRKMIRAITYKADFIYEKDGKEIVEDTKGFRTEAYKIKKKLLLYKYQDIDFREI